MVVVFFDVELMVKEVVREWCRRGKEKREREGSNADREIKSPDFMSVKIKTKEKNLF